MKNSFCLVRCLDLVTELHGSTANMAAFPLQMGAFYIMRREQHSLRALKCFGLVVKLGRGRRRLVVNADPNDDHGEAHKVEPRERLMEKVLSSNDCEEVGREQRQIEHSGVAGLHKDLQEKVGWKS